MGKPSTSIMINGPSVGIFESGGDKLERVSPCICSAAAEIVAIESEGPVLPVLTFIF